MNKIIIAVLLSVFAVPVFAGNEAGIYAGVKLGTSNVGVTAFGYGVYGGYIIDSSVTSSITSKSEFTKKLNFAGEVEYTSLGNTSLGGVTYSASAIGAVLAVTYPINQQFSAIAKAGLARSSHEVTCSGCGVYWPNINTSTIGLRYGAAGQYNLTQQIGLRAGYDAYPDGFSQLSAGAVFKF